MARFLEYAAGDTLLHRMNPVAKLGCSLVFAAACFATSNLPFLAAMLALALILARVAHLIGPTMRLIQAVLAFSLILAIVQVLTTPVGIPLVALPWGFVGTGSLLAALTTVVRLSAAAIPLFLAFYVTRITDLTNAVVKMLHVPYRYAFTFTATIRFIPLFLSDMRQIMESQTARGVEFDTGGLLRKLRLVAPLCMPLLVTSVRKTNSTAIAAELRGFNLRTRASGCREYPMGAADWAACAASLGLLAIAAALSISGVLLGPVA